MSNLSGDRIYDRGIGRCVWAVTNMVFASALWLISSASIVAAAPGTVALFALVRRWIDDEADVSVVSFVRDVKRSFWKANGLATIATGIALVLGALTMVSAENEVVHLVLQSVLVFVALTLCATATLALPSLAEERSLFDAIREAYRRVAQSPIWAAVALASIAGGYLTMALAPTSIALLVWLTAPVLASWVVTFSFRRAAGGMPSRRRGIPADVSIGSAGRTVPLPNPRPDRSITKRENTS